MEVNETNRPLTEVPAENAPETSVPTVEQTEKPAYALRQTQEEVVARLTEINKDACNQQRRLQRRQTRNRLFKTNFLQTAQSRTRRSA